MAIKPKSQLEKRIDGLKAGGVGKNVGNASEIFNNYSGSYANVIDGAYSAHAEGLQNTISSGSLGSHAEGVENSISSSAGSHVEGDFNHISSSDYSHAEGESCKIFDSKWAHAGGYGCYIISHADCGFAHGAGAKVTGGAAAAFGSRTLAAGRNQFVAGKGNIEDSEDKYALIIGNGTDDLPRDHTGFEASNALTLDWEGNLWVAGKIEAQGGGGATYTAGAGIDISKSSESSEISAKIDSKTIQFDADGKMYVPTVPLTLENAVVIQEADAKYLLHEYTQVEYIAGNRIGYAGSENQIIINGYTAVKSGNQLTAPIYQSATLYSFSEATVTEHVITAELSQVTSQGAYRYTIRDNGVVVGSYQTLNPDIMGFAITWASISSSATETAPHGYAYLEFFAVYETTTAAKSATFVSNISRLNYIFASEAEYNAAVGLTYEPQTLTQVNETVTEV